MHPFRRQIAAAFCVATDPLASLRGVLGHLCGALFLAPGLGVAWGQPGSLDVSVPAGVVPNGAVYTIAVQADGKTYVGGEFTTVGAESRVRLARLNSGGSLDDTFRVDDGPNSSVRTLALQSGGRVLVGGDFSAYRGQPNLRFLMRLNSDGAPDSGFAIGDGPNSSITAVRVATDEKILVAGNFTAFAGQPRSYLARLGSDGRLEAGYALDINAPVRCLEVDPTGRVWIGGNFSQVEGRSRPGLARLLPNGRLDETFDPASGTVGGILAMAATAEGGLWISGAFADINGLPTPYLGLVGPSGLPDVSVMPRPNAPVHALVRQADGRILVGGDFTAIGTTPAGRVARIRADGTLDTTFNTGTGAAGQVTALATTADGKLWVGGSFPTFGGVDRASLVRLETAGAALGGEIEFSASVFRVRENQPSIEIEVRRLGTTSSEVTVDYATRNGTANGGDYFGQAGKLTFSVGETRRSFVIPIRADTNIEDDETILLSLSNPTAGAELGGQASATLILENDDSAMVAGGLDSSFSAQTDGPVHAVAFQPDGKLVLGGDFSVVGTQSRRRIARVSADGSLDPGFLPAAWLNGRVLSLLVQGDGRILVGGDFTVANGSIRNRLARFLADGSLDPTFDPGAGPNSSVYAMLEQANGDLLIGGAFSAYAGENAAYLVRVFPDGARDPDFTVSMNGPTWALAWAGDEREQFWAGGDFTTVHSKHAPRVARLRLDGAMAESFNPGRGPNSSVRAVGVEPDGATLVAGAFSEVNGWAQAFLSRLDASGLPDVGFSPKLNGLVSALARTADGAWIAGGDFAVPGNSSALRVARLMEDGSTDPSFVVNGEVDGSVYCLAAGPDGRIVVGGSFSRFAGVARGRLVRLEGRTQAAGGSIEFGEARRTVAEGQASVLIPVVRSGGATAASAVDFATSNGTANAGDFSPLSGRVSFATGETNKAITISLRSDDVFEGRETFHVTLSNPSGGAVLGGKRVATVEIVDDDSGTSVGSVDAAFSNTINGVVNAMAVQDDGRILIGGDFSTLSDGARLRVARLEADGRLDTTFSASAWVDGPVYAVAAMPDGRVLVGGAFSQAGGIPRNFLARFNADGTPDPTFDPGVGPNGVVFAIHVETNGDILVGGAFSTFQGQPHGYIVRLFGDGNPDPRFTLQANGTIYCIAPALAGGWVVGGDFVAIGGLLRNRVAWITSAGTVDPTFNPGAGPNATVRAAAVGADGRVLVGGLFSVVQGVPKRFLARLERNGLPDPTHEVDLNSAVYAVALQADGRAVVGGEFTTVNGVSSPRLARILPDGALDPSFQTGNGADAAVWAVELQPDGNVVVGGSFMEWNGLAQPRLVRLQGLSTASGGVIEFASGRIAVDEAQTSIAIQVRRLGTSSEVVTVDYSTRNGSANAGDYEPRNGTLVFGAGDTTKTFSIPLRADTQPESDETILLSLENAGGGAELGGLREAVVAILDDDSGAGPGGVDGSFRAEANDLVNNVVPLSDGRIVVAGNFSLLGGAARNGVARLTADGTPDPSFSVPFYGNSQIMGVHVQDDGRIVLVGDFSTVNGLPKNRVVRLLENGAVDPGFDPGVGPNSWIDEILPLPGGGFMVGGAFTQFSGEARGYLARLLSDGSLDQDFTTSADGPVYSLSLDTDGSILVGGEFQRVGGQPRSRLARLTPAGLLDPTFDVGAGPNSTVREFLPHRGGYLVGGGFGAYDGATALGVVRLDRNGQRDASFASDFNATVWSLAIAGDGSFAAGGDFTRAGGRDVGRWAHDGFVAGRL